MTQKIFHSRCWSKQRTYTTSIVHLDILPLCLLKHPCTNSSLLKSPVSVARSKYRRHILNNSTTKSFHQNNKNKFANELPLPLCSLWWVSWHPLIRFVFFFDWLVALPFLSISKHTIKLIHCSINLNLLVFGCALQKVWFPKLTCFFYYWRCIVLSLTINLLPNPFFQYNPLMLLENFFHLDQGLPDSQFQKKTWLQF